MNNFVAWQIVSLIKERATKPKFVAQSKPAFYFSHNSLRPATKLFVVGWRKLLRKVERGSTLSNKCWLCCSFFIKFKTCLGSTSSKSTNQRAVFLQPATIFFVVLPCATSWSRKVETRNIDPKPATNFFYLVFRRHKRADVVSGKIDYFTDRLMFSSLLLLLSSLYVNVVSVYVLCGSYLRCNYLIYTI